MVELLVGMTITLAVTAAGLELALSSFSLYEADHARVELNQNLRTTQDFLATDLRQAGERLGDDFPAIVVIDGPSGTPDEIVVRRNLLGTVVRSCRLVESSERKIYIAELEDDPPSGCVPVPDSDGDGWPDNHGAWHDYRMTHGEPDPDDQIVIPAYIFDPVTGNAEFFTYYGDEENEGFILTPPGQSWQHSYPIENQCRIYMLEERRYRVEQKMLQVILNGDDPEPINLVDRIEDVQAIAILQDGTLRTSFGFADVWADLRSIDVTIRGRVPYDDGDIEAAWASEIMPRNVLSH